jgi:DNA polymerase beta
MKEEDASPSRNGYKVRSFQVAIAAINDHKKPIRSGQEAIKVRH